MVNKKEPNPKIAKAFQAMKDLGISQNKVKPVLRKLLSLYDKNWELIEEGNYRVLADAIFDNDEEEEEETPEKVEDNQVEGSSMMIVYDQGDYMDEEDLEPEQIVQPLKRLRRKGHDGEDSSQRSNIKIPSLVVNAENKRSELQTGTNDQNLASRAKCSSPSVRRNIENGSVSHQTPYSGRRFIPGALSFATTPRRVPKNHATPLNKPKDEPTTEDVLLQNPLAIIHPDATEQGTSSPREPILNGKPKKSSNEPFSKLEIASSPAGEVKMCFSCDLALQGPDFQMPTSEAVLKLAEDRCIKSYKIIDPNFSLKGVMKGVCQCFLELASIRCQLKTTEVIPESERHEFVDVTPSSKLPESLDVSLAVGLTKRELFSSVNGLVGPQSNDLSLVEVHQPQVMTPGIIRSGHDFDLTKGQENVVILQVDGNINASLSSFHYIPNNMVFQKANVNSSLSCIGDSHCCSTCSCNCLSLSSPCACASGGEFAYTKDGLVKEAFLAECISMKCAPGKHQVFFCKKCPLQRSKSIGSCKGHVLKKFIKECWVKCMCHKQCRNRVVQRGISRNLQVFMTPEGKGWGLRTMVDLPKGAFICEYAGEILTAAELFDRSSEGGEYSNPVILDADWSVEGGMEDEDALALDATHYGNIARFINHRCYDSNLVDIPVQIETPGSHSYYHVALFTTRHVKAIEELVWDYGIDFDDKDFHTKAFGCLCGSKFCRNK